MKKRRFVAILTMAVMLGTLAGCSSNESTPISDIGETESAQSSASEDCAANQDPNAEAIAARTEPQTVVVSWFNWTGAPAGLDRIEEKMNELTLPALNLQVEMQVADYAQRSQQLTLQISGGEQLDIVCSSFLYGTGITNGYWYDLEEGDLLNTYGADIISTLGMDEINSCRDTNGILYGIPNQKENAGGKFTLAVVTDYLKAAEPYMELTPDYDSPCWKVDGGLNDLVTVIKALHEAYPDKDAFLPLTNISGLWTDIDTMGDYFGVLADYGTGDIVSMFDDDSYLELVNTMHDLYNSGCINPSTLTDDTAAAVQVEAGSLCSYLTSYKPNSKVQETNLCGGVDITIVYGGPDFSGSSSISGDWAICVNTADPVAAMQYLNFMYSSPEWNNLFNWGEEGVDFNIVDGTAQFIENPEYNHAVQWIAPGQFLAYPEYGNSPDLWEQYETFNNGALKSEAIGFMFDQTPVINEYTAINNVYLQYQKSIEYGAVEPASALEEMKTALESAGYQKYLDEKQAQYTAWKQTREQN